MKKLLLTLSSLLLMVNVAQADFVILDDLIVDGSSCVGFDCVNGESFGFDTIRVKENNLRIKFEDTSIAASFPNNDWQLTANDSANGGAEKFSIDDIGGNRTPFTVEANARSHSLYVDDGGRIGNRTSTPSTEIHTIDGDTPTLRLQQDGSSGFAPQTWDVAGNETNFFVRDVTNGSTLPFRIRPGAPSSSIFIDVSGDVGMGTASPDDNLHILNNAAARIRLENSAAATSATEDPVWSFNSNGTLRVSAGTTGAPEFVFAANGDLTIMGELTTATATYPDYVFEDNYKLMPLDEVKAFIENEGHLPNIAPAEEIKKNGLNLSKLHVKLMEKVEELTLYTLEQHEAINELKQQIAKLQSENQ